MQVTYKLANGIQISLEAGDTKSAFHALALCGEALGETACGLCGSDNIRMEHRKASENDFFSWRCVKCGGQLDMGQHKTGRTLFAKRTLENGSYDSAHQGWYLWSERRKTSSGSGEAPRQGTQTSSGQQQQFGQSPEESFF